ncbi:Putative Pol polyprotein, partial [Nestor notabilis]
WPLTQEKLQAAKEIVKVEAQSGHLEPSTSPWNTPIFVIQKKNKNTWRLLHDLRAVNAQMEAMGPLQTGLPLASAIPQNWHIIIIDIRNCFFSIPLASEDRKRFAFTLPAINLEEPVTHWQWTVLPQGMKNSPTMCQRYVAKALGGIREKWGKTKVLHYMDDILMAAEDRAVLDSLFQQVQAKLYQYGLNVAEEKIQRGSTLKYLGTEIRGEQITAQPILINPKVRTLNNVQKLVGAIQWLRIFVPIPNNLMEPFYDLL